MSIDADDRTLILGIGSPFGADRAGWDAVELLRGAALGGVRLQTTDRPGARLLSLLGGTRTAILLDALISDAPAGTLLRVDPSALLPGARHSDHGFGVADALALGRVLGMLPPRVVVIGICVAGDRPPVLDAPALVAMIRGVLQETGAEQG